MSTKYQIFISSTFDDLETERSAVIKAILEMGHIPVGMEMFSAADEEQWKLIARQIDETDYYVVVVGHRYGSMTGSVSFTEKEFDYAISKGVPIYGFIVDGTVQPLAKNVDHDATKVAGLSKFVQKVKQRPVSFWKSSEDLHGRVSIALMKAFNTTPRPGWTRAISSTGPEVSQELSRLSKENADLRKQIESLDAKKVSDQQLELELISQSLKEVSRTLSLREFGKTAWDHKRETNLYLIFNILAPQLFVEHSVVEISRFLATMFRGAELKSVSATFPIASNHIKSLMADFHALGLVEPSKRKHAVSDKEEYWTLTDLGAELLKLERKKLIERSIMSSKAKSIFFDTGDATEAA